MSEHTFNLFLRHMYGCKIEVEEVAEFSTLAELHYIVVKINHKNNDFYALSHKMPDFLYGSMTALKMNKGNIIMVNLTSVFTLMKILGIESTLPSSHNDWMIGITA